MQSGMEMMFKSMGIDIEGIKQVLNPETVKRFVTQLESVSTKLDTIEQRLTRIELKLETMPQNEVMNLLQNGNAEVVEAVNAFVHHYNNAPIGTMGEEVGALEGMLKDARRNDN